RDVGEQKQGKGEEAAAEKGVKSAYVFRTAVLDAPAVLQQNSVQGGEGGSGGEQTQQTESGPEKQAGRHHPESDHGQQQQGVPKTNSGDGSIEEAVELGRRRTGSFGEFDQIPGFL